MTAADQPRVYVQTDPGIVGKVEIVETDGSRYSSSIRFPADLLPGLLASIQQHLAADQPTTEPSAVERAWDDGARTALHSEGYQVTDHAAVLASNPHRAAPALEPTAEPSVQAVAAFTSRSTSSTPRTSW